MTGQEFATEIVYPVLAILVSSAVLAGVVACRKLLMLLWDIKREVLPNGGGSLRDSVNRSEERLTRVEESTSRIESEQKHVKRKLEKHLKDVKAAGLVAA